MEYVMQEWEEELRSPAFAEVTRIFAERERIAALAAQELELDNRDRLIALATAAYGSRWQTETAGALHVSDRSVRAWVAGKTPVSDGVVRDLRGVVRERVSLLRTALHESSLDPTIESTPLIVDRGERGRTTLIVSVSDLSVGDGDDGDLVCGRVLVGDLGSEDPGVMIQFGEEVADGVFANLSSYHWAHHRDDWIDALGSAHVADVVFEAAKGLIRENRPDLVEQTEEVAVRQALADAGFEILGRDPTAHYHWQIRHVASDTEGWYASLRAAARELLPDD